MSKLERECGDLAARMSDLARDLEAFSSRRVRSLPVPAANALLKSSLALIGAASKVQLQAVKRTAREESPAAAVPK